MLHESTKSDPVYDRLLSTLPELECLFVTLTDAFNNLELLILLLKNPNDQIDADHLASLFRSAAQGFVMDSENLRSLLAALEHCLALRLKD
jgi:hypothetical protein